MDFKENTKAIYLQIADKICDEITNGIYSPGGRLPSVREYAAALQVNANTVVHTFDHLSQAGIIFQKRGVGFFVADDAVDVIRGMHEESFLDGEMQYFFSRLKAIGFTPEDISEMYSQFLNQD